MFLLKAWLFCFSLWASSAGLAWTDVTLSRVTVEPGLPGEWTNLEISVQNDGDKAIEARLEVVSGDMESGLSTIFWDVSLPAHGRWDRALPFLIPQPAIDKNAKRGSKFGSASRRFQLEAKLLVNGAIQKRESLFGAYLVGYPIYSLIDNVAEPLWDPSDPRDSLQKAEDFSMLAFKYLGENSKSRIKYGGASRGQAYSASLLSVKSILWKRAVDLPASEFLTIQNWVKQGGLLILESSDLEANTFNKMLNFYSVRHRLFYPHFPEISSPQILSGIEHRFGNGWSEILDSNALRMGGEKRLGLGRIVVLNVPWSDWVGGNTKLASRFLSYWLPEKLDRLMSYGNGSEATLRELSLESGKKVWSKSNVILYLFSILVLSIGISFIPTVRRNPEWRWGVWTLVGLSWTLVGVIFHVLSVDQSTRLSSLSWVLRSPQSPFAQEWGMASLISGERRRFALNIDDAAQWKPIGGEHHQEMTLNKNGVAWTDFALAPQVEQKIQWSQIRKLKVESEVPNLKVAEKWTLTTPKTWSNDQVVLVVGRRAWLVQAGGKTILNPKAMPLALIDRKAFPQIELIKGFLRNEEQTFNPRDRFWLFKNNKEINHPLRCPEDVQQSGSTMECWLLEPQCASGKIELMAGVGDIRFVRGGEEYREDRSFDGINFKASLSNSDLKWSLPSWAKSTIVSSMQLHFIADVDPMMWKMSWLDGKGQEKNIRLKGNSIDLPLESLGSDGSVTLRLHSRRMLLANDIVNNKKEQGLPLLGLEIKGVYRD